MDIQAIKDEITLQLTGDVLSFELTDATLTKIINSALREIQRYLDIVCFMTIPYQRCISLKDKDVNAVIKVLRSEGYLDPAAENGYTTMDPLYASQWQLLSGLGNLNNLTDYAYRYASWNTIMQIRNTTSTDLAFVYDKSQEQLYINVSSNLPNTVTIMYVPQIKDVEQLKSDFWIDNLIRLSIALTKITVGRVRTKFKQTNALWTLDGDTLLTEGTQELTAIRTELKENTQLIYGYD